MFLFVFSFILTIEFRELFMQKVLLISGRKQSGKTSAMNYLAGYLLTQAGLVINGHPISQFQLDEQGRLEVDYHFTNPNTGEVEGEWARFDICNQDVNFLEQAQQSVFPIIRSHSFADLLKEVCAVVFGLNKEELYGTDEQKNQLCGVKWESMYKILPHLKPKKKTKKELAEGQEDEVRNEYMTNREFMQYFGSDICRELFSDCWSQAFYNRVIGEGFSLTVNTDCRFRSEFEYGKEIDNIEVKCIRLTRNPFNSNHSSEVDFDGYEHFDAIIDNENMTQKQKGLALVTILRNWGWIV